MTLFLGPREPYRLTMIIEILRSDRFLTLEANGGYRTLKYATLIEAKKLTKKSLDVI